MLEVGDAIVHLRYGAGTVTGTRTITRDGEERQYYCIEIVNDAGTLLIPQDQIDESNLRLALGDTMLIEKEMGNTPEELDDKHQLRQTAIEKKINSRNPRLIVQALRDLSWRQHTGKLTGTDKRLRDSAFEKLADELALSTSMAVETARDRVNQIVENAMQHHIVEDDSGEIPISQ
jgi:RNA polymerase-interacting CarD/CdnL/TRCF family regulator